MIKLINFVNEREIGQTETDPETGIKTTLSSIDPETGKYGWDVDYSVDPQFVYNKLDQLVNYMDKVEKGTELGQIKDILKNCMENKLKNAIQLYMELKQKGFTGSDIITNSFSVLKLNITNDISDVNKVKLLNIKAAPAINLKIDLTKLILKCQFVVDSLGCILFHFSSIHFNCV